MKLRKRRISILLSMLLLLSVFQPAVALDVDPDFEQIYEIGTRLLGDIEHEKELYGLSGVNFDNLYIGEYIPAYIAKETGLTPSNIRYYPVLENGKWVATLTCSKSDGIWNAQLSNTFVPELPEISANDNLKLIFDSNTCYLSKNSAIHNLTRYNAVAERVNIASSPMTLSATDGRKLINKRAVEIGKFDDNIQSRSSLPNQVFLNVPLVSKFLSQSQYNAHQEEINKQSNIDASKIVGACWAAAARAIGLKYGIDKSLDQIYNDAGIEKYKGSTRGITETEETLEGPLYGLECIRYQPLDFSFQDMQQALNRRCPIIGQANANTLHAIAIRGYVRYENSSTHAGSFSYVENENFPATYVASSISLYQEADNEYSYSYKQYTGIINSFSVVEE